MGAPMVMVAAIVAPCPENQQIAEIQLDARRAARSALIGAPAQSLCRQSSQPNIKIRR
jgi:hypothetical protein